MSRKLINGERQLQNIAHIMDDWVANHPWARGGWVPSDKSWDEFTSNQSNRAEILWGHEDVPQVNDDVNPIQQVREEILNLCEVLLKSNSCQTAVEIGMGNCGGSHYLWSLIFDRVFSIDVNQPLIERHILDQKPHSDQSTFICGLSHDREIINEAGRLIKSCDFLLIDGDHLRYAVEADWRTYSHLVKPGGIIAFHDTKEDIRGHTEVASFVKDLDKGYVTGNPIRMQYIHNSEFVGISYYVSP